MAPTTTQGARLAAQHLVLYDGVCGLCNGFVRRLIKRDPCGVFVFAALQSRAAARYLGPPSLTATVLDTIYVVPNFTDDRQTVLDRADAVLFVASQLSWPYRSAAALARVLPKPLRDVVYSIVARHRYFWFGQSAQCEIPTPAIRDRFLDRSEW